MKISYAPHFKKSFGFLSKEVKKKIRKQIGFLENNLRHPSLRAKNTMKKGEFGRQE